MPTRHSPQDREPSLSEMLADPIVQAVMAGDGVSSDEVENLIRAAGRKRAGTGIETDRMDRQVSAVTALAE